MKSAYMVSFRAKSKDPNQHPHVTEQNVMMCAGSIGEIAEMAEKACTTNEIEALFIGDFEYVMVGGITLNHELAL